MTKKIFYLILIITSGWTLKGQDISEVPGYVGKRLSFALGTEVSPLMGAALPDKKVYSLQPKLTVSLRYVTGVRGEMRLYGNYRQAATLVPSVPDSDNMMPVYNDLWSVGFSMRGYTFHRKGSIAPLGSYWSINTAFASSIIIDDGRFLGKEGRRLDSYHTLLFGLGNGKQVIFKDRFMVDYGLKLTVGVDYFSLLTNDVTTLVEDDTTDEITRFEDRAMRNLAANYLITFYVEFGTLIK